ncbi:amylo-alpha-1,6-glucosidase [Catenuloplanes atrovinosus]|uniref:Glycogen debranching enzyme n=1 Tax=Catenuloplanes atrovinosus TaxID=137266 RepID=A0AAE3YKM2_9ACTN|nr:amylo-alpha-1,6-glucosidase [Catenuloplanes atrovinosus]MDR7273918.1 glycogen debranching enzyme [Catenuloplanes atrovinosus]
MLLNAPLIFGPQVCASLSEGAGASREWLVPDGVGGYAMGTISGLRTRRYHALLAVADAALTERHVALAALDATVTLPSGATVPLYTHEWASGAIAPRGHAHLELFELADGLPRWRWRIGDVVLERELAMAHGQPSLGVVHRLISAPGPVKLSLAAMCTWRDAHGERRADGAPLTVRTVSDGVVIEDAYRLAGPGWTAGGQWHLDAFARAEADRGLNPVEDLWHAGSFAATLEIGQALEVSAWAGDLGERPPPAATIVAAARDRAHKLVTGADPADSTAAALALAADAFIVDTASGPDVIAGYPWFNAYLGDTMTAYEGLFLDTGRGSEGAALLQARVTAAVEAADAGLLHDPVDGPLWLVHAVERHVTRLGDTDLAAALADPLTDLILRHVGLGQATRPAPREERPEVTRSALAAVLQTPTQALTPITPAQRQAPVLQVADSDGLLRHDSDRNALTWMNARLNGVAVTPRTGKPVEVNALWVNALAGLIGLLRAAGRENPDLTKAHETALASFQQRFAAPDGWLYDVVDAPPAVYPLGGTHHDDASLRPNQLLAFSLPHAPLRGEAMPSPIRVAGSALLTPLGLRSLAVGEFGYLGTHRGNRIVRDAAYHQGVVWPWLIGPYLDACIAAGLPTDGVLTGLEAHLNEWGLGSVSETAEGDAPHAATGVPFSARSVAELNRIRHRL